MTAVAMVIRNRMAAQNISLRTAIYKQQQFEPARNGSLTNYLTGIAEQSSSIINQLKNNGAYGAVDESQSIMDAYLKNGTKRVIPGFGDTRDDFDYLYFMTPKAFKNLNMDKEKCVTYTYTYKWTTSSGTAREDSHIFFVNWVKNRADRTSYRKKGRTKDDITGNNRTDPSAFERGDGSCQGSLGRHCKAAPQPRKAGGRAHPDCRNHRKRGDFD